MKSTIAGMAFVWLFAAHGAHADNGALTLCAESLQPHARLVFDAVNASPQPELSLRALLEKRVRELVFMDRLMVSAARPAAEAASQCLRIARNCTGEHC
jgi:hypothetical protein